jgi:hypothetical protein
MPYGQALLAGLQQVRGRPIALERLIARTLQAAKPRVYGCVVSFLNLFPLLALPCRLLSDHDVPSSRVEDKSACRDPDPAA